VVTRVRIRLETEKSIAGHDDEWLLPIEVFRGEGEAAGVDEYEPTGDEEAEVGEGGGGL
jgi:hypothetical protein